MKKVLQNNIIRIYKGWGGSKIFEFGNGTKWKQEQSNRYQKFRYHPKAKIYQEDSEFVLEVEGVKEKIKVTKIK